MPGRIVVSSPPYGRRFGPRHARRMARRQPPDTFVKSCPDGESALDEIGMKYVRRVFHVSADTEVVECCGCGMPVNQNNPRCFVMHKDAYMGTYGPCCAPSKKKQAKWHKRREKRSR